MYCHVNLPAGIVCEVLKAPNVKDTVCLCVRDEGCSEHRCSPLCALRSYAASTPVCTKSLLVLWVITPSTLGIPALPTLSRSLSAPPEFKHVFLRWGQIFHKLHFYYQLKASPTDSISLLHKLKFSCWVWSFAGKVFRLQTVTNHILSLLYIIPDKNGTTLLYLLTLPHQLLRLKYYTCVQ